MKIKGLDETDKALKDLDVAVAKRIIRKGLRAGAKDVLNAARADAPQRSGAIKRNIKIRGGGTKNGVVKLNIGVGAKDFQGKTFYAGFVLYGHKVGSRKLGDARTAVPANNFLERAYESSGQQAVETTTEAWKELIEKEASKK